MVLSKMYCSEQIVIPEKISNLLKTYAKAALKTQPYDLLRWSAAYFRCLSMDMMPPVKPRYEQECMLGCLTKGYMKVLLSQLGKGFFVRRDVLEHRWNELCLPEEELLKFLSLTRMLYWPQVHWLRVMSAMVGSINQNFNETVMMLFELLTDEPEGGSSPIPLWLFRECFKYLAEFDCSAEQTFFDGRKVLPGNVLEDEVKIPNIPQKLSSTSFRNAVIDYWKYRIENDEKVKSQHAVADANDSKSDTAPIKNPPSSSSLRNGSALNISGDFQDPMEVVQHSCDFDSILLVLQRIKCHDDGEKFHPESKITEQQREKIKERDDEVAKLREQMESMVEENAQICIEQKCCEMLKEIGPPWNWLHNFASQNCHYKSYNFLETESIKSDVTVMNENEDGDEMTSDDSFDYLNDNLIDTLKKQQAPPSASTIDDIQSTTSTVSIIFNDEGKVASSPSNEHKVLVETICNISDAVERGDCNIRETTSIVSLLSAHHDAKQLETMDYERLKRFIDKAAESGLVFNDLNALYNYFIQESCRDRFERGIASSASSSNTTADGRGVRGGKEEKNQAEADVKLENVVAASTSSGVGESTNDGKNVVEIFGESGIEVDNKLLDATVSDRMILGLVDKSQIEDNASISSNASMSSLSHAETVKMKDVTFQREKDTQTMSYKERVHEKRIQKVEKSKSASSIKRQPFTCKIPPLPGIAVRLSDERIDRILRFITYRSFQQGGFVYPRNILEDECPNLTE